jgi:hypothetical protein
VIALAALACVVIGLLTSRLVGIGVFAVVLLFTVTYRGPSKTRAHRASPAPTPPAPLPAARIAIGPIEDGFSALLTKESAAKLGAAILRGLPFDLRPANSLALLLQW